jgi:hypothetical protein
MQVKQMELQARDAETRMKLEMDKYKADLEAQVKVALEQFQAEHQERMRQMDHSHAQDLEDSRADASIFIEDKRLGAKEKASA